MKSNIKLNTFASLGAAALLLLGAGSLSAQDRGPGNFDPEQMRQRMMERMREQFEVKDDGEWKVISERLTKVTEARMATMSLGRPGGPGGFRGGPGGPGGGGGERPQGGPDGNAQGRPPGGGGPGGPGGFAGFNRPSDPDMDALQKAIDAKASADEIKGLLAKVRASRQAKQAQLEKAQADLREVLSVRQEAIAVMMGMLN